ncbi:MULTISPECIES: hypothetical protein [Peribacillus]|uniref:hypothetical protein n=1 Tax=Peribacillus TaxID=2675229 RepID=UPI00203C4025|nr:MULTISPECIES: hypothetical protein [Peribacillus]MCM3676075.1 hypothetical protein [Peribacillus simplex]
MLFMSGDGIEQAFLYKYIVESGFSVEQSSWAFTVYGITLIVASWLAGVLTDLWSAKKTMFQTKGEKLNKGNRNYWKV